MKTELELERCPFCGGKAIIEKYDYGYHIGCNQYGCFCDIEGSPFWDSEEDAAEAWNCRVYVKE